MGDLIIHQTSLKSMTIDRSACSMWNNYQKAASGGLAWPLQAEKFLIDKLFIKSKKLLKMENTAYFCDG